MSEQGMAASAGIDWQKLGSDVAVIAEAVSPLFPGASAAIAIGAKIVQGVVEGVPTAIALYDQVVLGQGVTADDVAKFRAAYVAADDKLEADIEAALKVTPA